jgi:hypothetical protein
VAAADHKEAQCTVLIVNPPVVHVRPVRDRIENQRSALDDPPAHAALPRKPNAPDNLLIGAQNGVALTLFLESVLYEQLFTQRGETYGRTTPQAGLASHRKTNSYAQEASQRRAAEA